MLVGVRVNGHEFYLGPRTGGRHEVVFFLYVQPLCRGFPFLKSWPYLRMRIESALFGTGESLPPDVGNHFFCTAKAALGLFLEYQTKGGSSVLSDTYTAAGCEIHFAPSRKPWFLWDELSHFRAPRNIPALHGHLHGLALPRTNLEADQKPLGKILDLLSCDGLFGVFSHPGIVLVSHQQPTRLGGSQPSGSLAF